MSIVYFYVKLGTAGLYVIMWVVLVMDTLHVYLSLTIIFFYVASRLIPIEMKITEVHNLGSDPRWIQQSVYNINECCSISICVKAGSQY